MTPERWTRVEELYHAARARPPNERPRFLSEACPHDEALRREVESLLAEAVSDDGFLNGPALAMVAQVAPELLPLGLIGRSLGGYDLQALLGAGGMGDVYRARDTKLGRDVAIKILPAAFGQDADRLARFDREARMLAALNHSNICTIYGHEESDGLQFLILELVEGVTLGQMLSEVARREPRVSGLPLSQALPIARQIAAALEVAHEKGIIHRDLKPANIKITPAGVVKVLDFGLAKAVGGDGSAPSLTHAPLDTRVGRSEGAVLGTATYMSPEQARGLAVDKRTDIWAFGCVLYEMLTGRVAFAGDTVPDTIAKVLEREPDWSALPAETPAIVCRLLFRCLTKDPKQRLRDVGDVRIEIDGIDEALPGTSDVLPASALAPASARATWIPWVLAGGLALGLTVVFYLWAPWRSVIPSAPVVVNAAFGADLSLPPLRAQYGDAVLLSPDGDILVFLARQGTDGRHQLYVRRLNQAQASPLSGTDDAESAFFSPDGRWIGFFADGKLKKVAVTGGAPVTLADAPVSRGGAWSEDGTIVFSPQSRAGTQLLRVSAAGERVEPLASLADGEAIQVWPQVLPGDRGVLYTSSSFAGDYNNADLVVQPLPNGPRKIVQRGGFHGRYLPSGLGSPNRAERTSGHLVFIHDGTLFATPFDLGRLEATGETVPALGRVTSNSISGGAHFAAGANGVLVYLPGPSTGAGAPIHWMDPGGTTKLLRAAAANWFTPLFAPDGRRLLMEIRQGQSDIWIYDWARDTLTSITSDAAPDTTPVWSPDGQRIVFGSARDDGLTVNLYWQRADGTGQPQRLTVSKNAQKPGSWHPSGRLLAFDETTGPRDVDLMILPVEDDEASGWKAGKPEVFLDTAGVEFQPMFSPDGRWLAYTSNESGRLEVYVRPFPGPGARSRISNDGGALPTWSRVRRELFYGADGQVMVVPYTVDGNAFVAEKPRLWSEGRYQMRGSIRMFDLHPDGTRFAVASAAETPSGIKQDHVTFIFNFFDELRRLAPARR